MELTKSDGSTITIPDSISESFSSQEAVNAFEKSQTELKVQATSVRSLTEERDAHKKAKTNANNEAAKYRRELADKKANWSDTTDKLTKLYDVFSSEDNKVENLDDLFVALENLPEDKVDVGRYESEIDALKSSLSSYHKKDLSVWNDRLKSIMTENKDGDGNVIKDSEGKSEFVLKDDYQQLSTNLRYGNGEELSPSDVQHNISAYDLFNAGRKSVKSKPDPQKRIYSPPPIHGTKNGLQEAVNRRDTRSVLAASRKRSK